MEQTSKFKHYLKMAWSGAGMFLLLFLALCLIMLVLDKMGMDHEVMHFALLAPGFVAVHRIGVLRVCLGVALIAVIVVIPVALLYYTPLGEGFFKWLSQLGQ